MPRRLPPVVVCSLPNPAGHLSVVRVDGSTVTLSTGEVLIARWERLRHLAEWLCQEQCPIWIRTWTTKDGNELIELHRSGETPTVAPTETPSEDSDVF